MIDNLPMLQCKTSVSRADPCRAGRRHRAFVVIGALALTVLAGCGQKGPLKLPPGAAPASAPAAK
jgi:predicted small lipoprotein YifL